MNYFNRIPVPITYTSEEKVKEVKIRTYPDNQMHLLQDSYSIDTTKKEKCTLLWLNQGKCLYQFMINNTKHLNLQKPIEQVNNDYFNILIVTKESKGLEIKENSIDLKSNFKRLIGREKNKSPSIEDNYQLTLSIKGENHIQEIHDQDNAIQVVSPKANNEDKPSVANDDRLEEEEDTSSFDKVIVYRYNNEHLIEMRMTPYESDNPDLICLKYENNPDADMIIVNKNEIFYQSTKTFEKSTDVSKLSTINEMTIMKTIHHSILDKKDYIIVNDIMIVFSSNEPKLPSSNMINAFLSIGDNSLIVIKGKETAELTNAIKSSANESLTDSLLFNLFSLCRLMRESTLLHISIKDNDIQFNLLPVINSQDTSSLSCKSILLNKDQNQTKLVKISSEASKEIHSIALNEEDEEIILEFCNYNARVINIIYNIMTKSNMIHLFKDYFKGLFICYLVLLHYKTYNDGDYEDDDSNGNNLQHNNVNEHLVIYYSNIMTLAIVRSLLQMITTQYGHDATKIKLKCKDVINREFLFIYSDDNVDSDSQQNDVAYFLNEILYRRHSSSQPMNKSNSDLIANVLLNSFNESILGWKSQISNYFTTEILSRYDSVFASLKVYNFILNQQGKGQVNYHQQDKESKTKSIDSLTLNIHKGFTLLQQSELSYTKMKQLLYVPMNSSLESFIYSNSDQIVSFIHYHKLIEYGHDGIEDYFCYLSIKDFSKHFLPLINDASHFEHNEVNHHQDKIKHFLLDLQTLQKIKDPFEVNSEGVSIGFKTFEIMINLIQTLKNDKAIYIQSYFRQYLIKQIINQMRLSATIIQNKWRNYFYQSMTDAHYHNTTTTTTTYNNEFIPGYLINKFKKKDALLLKYLLGMKKVTSSLFKENIKLKQKYTLVNCQRSTNFNFKSEMTKRSNCDANSSSSSSLFANDTAKQNKVHTKSFFLSSSSLVSVNPKMKTMIANNQSHTNKDSDMHLTTAFLKENSEIKALNDKIEESKRKYREMVTLAADYEKKIDGLITLINSKKEVREILIKNGVQFT